jgi:two-component system, LytTR family, response regulator
MTAIIVDDEKHCREVLELLLNKHCSHVKILASCTGGDEAIAALEKETPNILFLDIEMPGINGFELLKKISHQNFEIVFTTAYNEYAIKAIKHSALDYLLKPVDKDELIQAVHRVKEHKTLKDSRKVDNLLELLNIKNQNKRFAVPTMEGLIMVDSETILYCESDSAYCKIFLKPQPSHWLFQKP